MDGGVSTFDLQGRAERFANRVNDERERAKRQLEKERILQERVAARKRAHDRAMAELRRRQEEEAEQVRRGLRTDPSRSTLVAESACTS